MSASRLTAKVIDAGWLRRNVNCRAACPVHTNAQGYIEAIAKGDFDSAYKLARMPNPFVNICARICGHPCEAACRRGVHDQPISIRALKRAAADFASTGMRSGGALPRLAKQHKKVAVIGGGPSGITAAHDLTLLGYDVSLYEASGQLGGMLRRGVPEYRLPRDVLDAEIESLISVGIEVHTNSPIGEKMKFAELRKRFAAIFLAVGAQKGRDLRIEGVDADGVINGIDFLLNVNLGYKVPVGHRVVVIGGGNVAVDVARTAAREAGIIVPEDDRSHDPAIDVARSAVRAGASEVHMVCLESYDEMPAHEDEVQETLREGVVLHNSLGPRRVIATEGRCSGLETVKCTSVFDDTGRFNPKFAEGTESVLPCDTILIAVGQQPDLGFLTGEVELDMTPGGFVKAIPDTMATNVPGLYVGGDLAFGARTAIEGIADGRRAARAIHKFLSGSEVPAEELPRPRLTPIPMHSMPAGYDRTPRQEVPTIPVDRRTGVTEVEEGFTREAAMLEASRCLTCNRAPMVDWNKCVLCGGCVDICPFQCLKIVPVSDIEPDEKVGELAGLHHGITFEEMADPGPHGEPQWFVMLKDEEKCTRCALCVERCPVDAMWMAKYEEVGYAGV
ncbi:MAG TPA: FAD-dependent oxidoreductase [Fimbriimonadaceae bacterium]|nr:FAD-dependent oxidoreductase [Fimbriimonadaceae bacterium]